MTSIAFTLFQNIYHQLGSSSQRPAHTQTASLRLMGTRSLCPGCCSHLWALNNILGVWEAMPSILPTSKHHLWSPWGSGVYTPHPTYSWTATLGEALRNWKAALRSFPRLGQHLWDPWGLEVCDQQPRVIQKLSGLGVCVHWLAVIWEHLVRPTRTGNLHPMNNPHFGTVFEAHSHWEAVTGNLESSKNP